MQPVLLPSSNVYITVDYEALQWAMDRINANFLDLLENGAQALGIPEETYAAGQHLNPYSLNQRGLYGTAAALLVLGRSRPASRRIQFVEGLIRYVSQRATIEETLLHSEEDRAWLTTRLLKERRSTFKCAELLYSLAAAPPATAGRETLMRSLLDRLHAGHREGGGWAAELNSARDRDALATASVVRALSAAGMAVDDVDIASVRQDSADSNSVSPYVRIFCILVLLEINNRDEAARKWWEEVFGLLRPELRDRIEADYEFTFGNRQEYIRILWQLYLISGAAICRPLSLIFESDIRKTLLDALRALDSAEGYIYHSFGHMKSTRTYSILMDTLWRVQVQFRATRYMAHVSSAANWGIRIIYSRAISLMALTASLGLVVWALYAWIAQDGPLGVMGPEILSGVLLGVISYLLNRVRRRRT
jgi:hypothetical protein